MSLFDSTLAGVCSLVTDGTHDTPKSVADGFPLVKAKEIVGGIIDFDQCEKISEADHKKVISRSKPEFGDTLFAHIGASLGEAAFVNSNREFSIKNVALFKPNPNIVVPRYLYYYVISHDFQERIKAMRTGSAQPFLGLSQLRGFSVRLHRDLSVQHRIASILSAYDDLIENNTRRIAILEEMARRIYEEWFVRFRFPGHEQVKMVESELGLIPEDWKVQTVEHTFQILGGGTPSKAEPTYWEDGTINWYSPTDLTRAGTSFMDCSSARITELGLSKSSARLFPPMSVMMTSRATIGVVAVNTTEACTNQGFITCLPSADYPLWLLYHWLKANVDTFIGLGTGATFKEITKGTFKGIKLAVPPQTLVGKFSDSVERLMNLSLNLQRKNRNLRITRDLLLPKLISGELDVSTLPKPEEAIAA